MPLIGERPELDLNAVVYGTDFPVFSVVGLELSGESQNMRNRG